MCVGGRSCHLDGIAALGIFGWMWTIRAAHGSTFLVCGVLVCVLVFVSVCTLVRVYKGECERVLVCV
jgi:hypothetical protein